MLRLARPEHLGRWSQAALACGATGLGVPGLLAAAGLGGARWYSPGYQPPSGDPIRAAFSYCINQVKTHDYESYLWCIQLPKELRAPIFALRAFNVETAMIGDAAKNEMMLLMRCQWWRDSINATYKGSPPDQPVLQALHQVMQQRPLTRYRLQKIINTREADFSATDPPPSLKSLEEYAEGTASQLLQLQMEAAGIESPEAEAAALSLGKAVGITNLLRGTLHHAERGRVYLPQDQCSLKGVDPRDLLLNKPSKGLQEVTQAVAADAKLHLEEARALCPQLPPAARMLLLPAVSVGMFLDALLSKDCNLLDQSMLAGRAYSPITYQLRLKWNIMRGTY